jgi:hypothetical protein
MAAKAPADGWRTILQMGDIWQEKGSIRLVNYQKDIEEIHTVIQAYFQKLADFQRGHDGGRRNLRTLTRSKSSVWCSSRSRSTCLRRTSSPWQWATTLPARWRKTRTMIPIPTENSRSRRCHGQKYSPASDIIDFNRPSQRKRY